MNQSKYIIRLGNFKKYQELLKKYQGELVKNHILNNLYEETKRELKLCITGTKSDI
jgi:hypothetical protein